MDVRPLLERCLKPRHSFAIKEVAMRHAAAQRAALAAALARVAAEKDSRRPEKGGASSRPGHAP